MIIVAMLYSLHWWFQNTYDKHVFKYKIIVIVYSYTIISQYIVWIYETISNIPNAQLKVDRLSRILCIILPTYDNALKLTLFWFWIGIFG